MQALFKYRNIFKITWIQSYIRSKDELWYYIHNIIFGELGGIEFLLNCYYNINKLPVKLSNFHKQALLLWMISYKHSSSPHKCLIWKNKQIIHQNISLFLVHWFKKDIFFAFILHTCQSVYDGNRCHSLGII